MLGSNYAAYKYIPKTKSLIKIKQNCFLNGQSGKYKQKETISYKTVSSPKSIKETKKKT